MTRLIKSVLTLALLLGLSGIRLQAQPDTAYHPMRQQGPVPERMMLAPEVRAERQLQMLDHYRDLNRLQLYSYNLQRDQALQEAFLSGDILFGDTLSRYVAGIFARILAANAELSPKNRVFLTRYTVPNAVNWNEYTTFLNMGLLSRLASEAEVAYVLCHELAHQRLRHGLVQLQHQLHAQQRLARDARSLVAGKSRREVRNSLPMLQYTLEQKALRALLEAYRHSREAELQADSLGLALYRKTGYPAQAAATALARLETCDADAYPTRLDLHVALSTDEYSWPHDPTAYRPPAAGPDKEAALIDTLQQLGVPLTADSLATHPAIPLRLQQLNALLVGSVPDTTLSPVVDARHAGIVRWARYASAYTHYRHGDYGRSLYEVLQLARQQPGEPFLHALVVLNLM
ncbi:MAG: M48 family metalloprotease, partial [Sphingobacteriia bacterium]